MPVLHIDHRLKRAAGAALLIFTAGFATSDAAPPPPRDARVDRILVWIEANSDRSGLPRSHVGDESLENWTFTYDAASTALAYLAAGETRRAQRILDYYLKTRGAYRLGGVIEAVNPASSAIGEDYGVRAGSNVWLGIASYHLFKATKDIRYLRFAKQQADFAIHLQINDAGDLNDGAVRMGPAGGGQTPGDQHLEFDERLPALYDLVSTENNLDAYALFGMIAHEAPPRVTAYARAHKRVFDWLQRVAYDRKEGRFIRGASKQIDTTAASDVQSWAVSALGRERLDGIAPDATDRLLTYVETSFVVSVPFERAEGSTVTVTGVDFIDGDGARKAGRSRMVSPEWTFQLANAYLRAATGPAADALLQKRRRLIDGVFAAAVPEGDGLAFPYATLPDAPVGHGWRTPARGTESVVGAAWAILALTDTDPLISGR